MRRRQCQCPPRPSNRPENFLPSCQVQGVVGKSNIGFLGKKLNRRMTNSCHSTGIGRPVFSGDAMKGKEVVAVGAFLLYFNNHVIELPPASCGAHLLYMLRRGVFWRRGARNLEI